jgi:hypothetical protein
VATCRAIEAAAEVLFAEREAARNELALATAACRGIIDQILAADARSIALEWIAATKLCWALQDRLVGLMRISDGAFLSHKHVW